MWWDSETGIRYVYYNDGTSSQWVQESYPAGGITNPYNQPFSFANTNASTSTSTGAITVSGGAGIAGNVYAGNLRTTGVISVGANQAVNGPAFSAYPNSGTTQTIPSGTTQTKVLFQQEDFDTDNNFSSSRFTPTVAGYYQLNAGVRLDGGNGTGECMIVIWKNGAEWHRGWNSKGVQFASDFWSMTVSALGYANGTGDYFEVYVQHGNAASLTVTVAGGNITYFNGCMVRGA